MPLHVFYLHFLRTHRDYFFPRGFEIVPAHCFSGKKKVGLLLIYLFNYDLSKSTFSMENVAFDIVVNAVFVK